MMLLNFQAISRIPTPAPRTTDCKSNILPLSYWGLYDVSIHPWENLFYLLISFIPPFQSVSSRGLYFEDICTISINSVSVGTLEYSVVILVNSSRTFPGRWICFSILLDNCHNKKRDLPKYNLGTYKVYLYLTYLGIVIIAYYRYTHS